MNLCSESCQTGPSQSSLPQTNPSNPEQMLQVFTPWEKNLTSCHLSRTSRLLIRYRLWAFSDGGVDGSLGSVIRLALPAAWYTAVRNDTGNCFFLSRLKVLRACPLKPLEQAGVRWLSIKTAFLFAISLARCVGTCAIGLWLSLGAHMVWPRPGFLWRTYSVCCSPISLV